MDEKKRIEWIDVAKGIAMILVFYGHLPGSGDNPWFPDLMTSRMIVYYFHMLLFFVLSGLTMRLNGDFKPFLYKRFRRLIVPYYFFSLYALAKIAIKLLSPSTFAGFHAKGLSGPWQELGNIVFGNSFGLWFFWALFWGDVIMFLVYRLPSRNWMAVVALLALCLWYLVSIHPIALPFQLGLATEAVGFSGIGYLISARMRGIDRRKAPIPLVISVLAFVALTSTKMILPRDAWMQFLPTILLAVAGSGMVIFLSVLLPTFRWLTYIGRNTIVFYGLNGLSLALARTLFFHVVPVSIVAAGPWLQLASGLVIICIACAVCRVACMVINRWLWWSIGLSRPDGGHSPGVASTGD